MPDQRYKQISGQPISAWYRPSKFRLLVFILSVSLLVIAIKVPQSMSQASKKKENAKGIISLPARARVVDLTQVLNEKVPSYEGKAGDFEYHVLTTVDKDGYRSGSFCMHEHLGTHMDAPVHFCKGGLSIDKLKPSNLVAPIIVIDVRKEAKKNPDYFLTIGKIKELETKTNIANHAAFSLLTGWDKRYFKEGQYRNADAKGLMHFPTFRPKQYSI